MDRLDNNTRSVKGKHLNYEKRIKIEALSKLGLKSGSIAEQIGCSERTIRRELAKGRVELLNSDLTVRYEYSADVGQQKHDYAGTGKGPKLKIGKDYAMAAFIEKEIKEALDRRSRRGGSRQGDFQTLSGGQRRGHHRKDTPG